MVVDGLPIVTAENKPRLLKVLLKRMAPVGKTKEEAVFMPMNEENKSEG